MYQPPREQPVIQPWVSSLPLIQQTVLLTAVRGPDGLPKYHPTKYLLRWYRRCLLYSAMDRKVLLNPWDVNGGSFTGPSLTNPTDDSGHWGVYNWQEGMNNWVTEYLRSLDQVPLHFHLHLMHAIEVMGYKYPANYELDPSGGAFHTRFWWNRVYNRFVDDMHLYPETRRAMDARLGDNRGGWLARGDVATND